MLGIVTVEAGTVIVMVLPVGSGHDVFSPVAVVGFPGSVKVIVVSVWLVHVGLSVGLVIVTVGPVWVGQEVKVGHVEGRGGNMVGQEL